MVYPYNENEFRKIAEYKVVKCCNHLCEQHVEIDAAGMFNRMKEKTNLRAATRFYNSELLEKYTILAMVNPTAKGYIEIQDWIYDGEDTVFVAIIEDFGIAIGEGYYRDENGSISKKVECSGIEVILAKKKETVNWDEPVWYVKTAYPIHNERDIKNSLQK